MFGFRCDEQTKQSGRKREIADNVIIPFCVNFARKTTKL